MPHLEQGLLHNRLNLQPSISQGERYGRAQAQAEVFAYLQWENELIKDGKAPEHHHTVEWLEKLADKWAHCPGDFANSRGFNILDKTSLTNTPQLEDKTDDT